jgi:hypothetical protein
MAVPVIFKELAERLPDAAYKSVNMRGGFTSIDAYHIVEKLTSVFGLCGVGFGMRVDTWHTTDKAVAAEGVLWYRLPDAADDSIYEVPAIGEGIIRSGSLADAMKMAQTNMLSKASSFIGVGLAIYKGQHVDTPLSVEVKVQQIRPGTLAAIEGVSDDIVAAATGGRTTNAEDLEEKEGRHIETVLEFEALVTRADDGEARRDKWLAAQGKTCAAEVGMGALRQVIRSLREGITASDNYGSVK